MKDVNGRKLEWYWALYCYTTHWALKKGIWCPCCGKVVKLTYKEVDKVTRFEVIDHREKGEGRVFVAYKIKVELMYQDDGRTLKVRITDVNR